MSVRSVALTHDWQAKLSASALPLVMLAIAAAFAIASPAFLSPDNLVGIVRQVALIGIMAACMTFVIMTGGVDLSVGPVLALAGLASFFSLDAGLPLPIVILAGLAMGVAAGLVNGLLVAYLQLPPIIVTLATLGIVRGVALIVGGPEQHLIRNEPAFSFIGSGIVMGLPLSVYIFLLVLLLMIPKNNTPSIVLVMEPLPPMMLVPPRTTAAITSSSVPKGP